MADSYVVAFKGQLAEGAPLDTVKMGVSQLFKVDIAKIEHLFSGQWVSIKKGVDEATAKKYQEALQKVGALCQVVTTSQFAVLKSVKQEAEPPKVEEPSLTTQPATPAEKRELESSLPTRSESEAVPLERSVVKAAPAGLGELEGVAVEGSWDHLEEPDHTPPPQVDLAGVALDAAGTDLAEHHDAPQLQVDTGELALDALGVNMAEHEEVPDLAVDTSAMVLDEPGVIIVEHKPVEEPEIDTSKISLE